MKHLFHKHLLLLLVAFANFCNAYSQTSVGINTQSPNSNAVLELVSPENNQGLLIPKLTSDQRNAISSSLSNTESGLMIFCPTDTMFYFWNGSGWQKGLANLTELYNISYALSDSSISHFNKISNLNNITSINTSNINTNTTELDNLETALNKLIEEQTLAALLEKGNSANNKIANLATPEQPSDATNKQYVDKADSLLNLTVVQNTTLLSTISGALSIVQSRIGQIGDSIQTNTAAINAIAAGQNSLRDSVQTNISTISNLQSQSKIQQNKISYLYNTGRVSLPNGAIFIGSQDSAQAVIPSGAINIDNTTGIVTINDGTIIPSHINGIADNGKTNQILKSNGDGTFSWQERLDGAVKDDLKAGAIYIGDATNKATAQDISGAIELSTSGETRIATDSVTARTIKDGAVSDSKLNKSAIPLSGFGNAEQNVAVGDGTTNYKITGVAIPTDPNDVMIKQYVDDSLSALRGNIVTITKTIKQTSFELGSTKIFVGDANDTARAVALHGDVAIVDQSGKTAIQDGAIKPSYLDSDASGSALNNGALNYVLTSNGNGSFKWGDPDTTTILAKNIPLSQGAFLTGNASNKASETAKNTIPISGFGNATTDIAIGNGSTNYKITGVANPANNSDVATKRYVDDSINAIRNTQTSLAKIVDSTDFSLKQGYVFVGNTKNISEAVELSGDIKITDPNGTVTLQKGIITADNLASDLGSHALSNGTLDFILTSNGDGSFKWTNPSTTPVDPNNISLSQGNLFVGNASDKAQGTTQNAISISGFGNATNDVAIGNGTTNYKITGVANPTDPYDAAPKKYVDDSVSVLRDSIRIYNEYIEKIKDSIVRVTNTIERATFELGATKVFVGDANDTARAVSLHGDVAIVDQSGKTAIQDGSIKPSYLDSDGSGASLGNGVLNYVLTSNGNGSFKWGDPDTTTILAKNIPLSSGTFFTGNASNKASETAKNAIPISGFGNATNDVAIGNGTTNYKITGVATPTDPYDAASKKYVDDSVSVLRDSIKIYNEYIEKIRDSIIRVTNTIERTSFELGSSKVFVGDANDTARAVSLHGDVAIVDQSGKTAIQNGVVYAENLANDLTGTALGTGTLDFILTSNGDGSFKWTNPSTTPVDPNNITLAQGDLFVGNASNKAEGVAKTTISISGFANAATDVAIGDGVTNYKITGVANPTDPYDAASKKYVDDSVSVLRDSIKIYNEYIEKIKDSIIRVTNTIERASFELGASKIFVGDANDTARAVSMSGDATIATNGKLTIETSAITSSKIANETITTDDIKNGDVKTADVANANITLEKIQDIATGSFIGRNTAGTGSPETLDVATAKSMLSLSNANSGDVTLAGENYLSITNQQITAGAVDLSGTNATGTLAAGRFPALSGDITTVAGSLSTSYNNVVPSSKGGTGQTSFDDGELLIGKSSDHSLTKATLTGTTSQIIVSNGSGSITLSTPQDIATSSSPTFAGLRLNGATSGTIAINAPAIAGTNTITLPAASGTLALTGGTISANNIPRWDGNNLINSNMWCSGSGSNQKVVIGSENTPGSFSFGLEVVGSFKTAKIYHSSDRRWKKNIKPIDSALLKVEQLQGVTYNWKTREFPEKQFTEGTQIGLIAQDVETVLPELVCTDSDGYKAVEYSNIVAVLIEAIKEQQQLIEDQNKKIASLQATIDGNADDMKQIEEMQVQMANMQSQIASLTSLIQMMAPTASSK